jgi:DNA-binding NtrC family response regulator
MAGDKVLLVDDEKEFTSVLSERMESRGLKVATADSGPAAIAKAETEHFDAIILDLKMPGMDGIETLKRLRTINPDLQIIMLTGYATVKKGVEAMKLGAVEFLEKPADIKELMEKIREARTRRLVLVEKQTEERIRDILESRGW